MQGWIKLHRDLLDKPIWLKSTPEQKTILITLLMLANHKGNEWEWQGKKFKVEPGQFVTSLDSLVNACGEGITIKNVRTALNKFEKYGFLANESTKTGRLITLVNWDIYQGEECEGGKDTGKEVAKTGQRGGKEVASNKNDNNVNNEKNDNKIYITISGVDKVKLTQEQYDKLITDYSKQLIDKKILDMDNYVTQKNKPYKDYNKALRTWLRNEKVENKPNQESKQEQYRGFKFND